MDIEKCLDLFDEKSEVEAKKMTDLRGKHTAGKE